MAKIIHKEKTPEEKADWERKCKRDGILNKKFYTKNERRQKFLIMAFPVC